MYHGTKILGKHRTRSTLDKWGNWLFRIQHIYKLDYRHVDEIGFRCGLKKGNVLPVLVAKSVPIPVAVARL